MIPSLRKIGIIKIFTSEINKKYLYLRQYYMNCIFCPTDIQVQVGRLHISSRRIWSFQVLFECLTLDYAISLIQRFFWPKNHSQAAYATPARLSALSIRQVRQTFLQLVLFPINEDVSLTKA